MIITSPAHKTEGWRLHTFTVHRTLCSSALMVYSKLCPFHKNKLQQPVALSLSILSLFVFLSLFFIFSVSHTLSQRERALSALWPHIWSFLLGWIGLSSLRPPSPKPRSHCHRAGHYPPPRLRSAVWHSLPPSCQSPFHLNKIKHKCGVGAHTHWLAWELK